MQYAVIIQKQTPFVNDRIYDILNTIKKQKAIKYLVYTDTDFEWGISVESGASLRQNCP
jgi:hypothetical protein